MPSCGNLVFYGKKGLSEPYPLNCGKITIGSSTADSIRIREDNISCELDTNEFGVTTLINLKKDEKVLVNNAPSKKYTLIHDGDILEFGKIKLKYSHPCLEKEHLEKAEQILNKRCGISENVITKTKILGSPSLPLDKLSLSKGRFSTGCRLFELKNAPKYKKDNMLIPNQTSTPLSASKTRFSQRIIARRNSSLAAVKENEEFDHSKPITGVPTSPIPKKRSLFSIAVPSPLAKGSKTFSGLPITTPHVPSKNKTYSGNISDVSENVTTPENNVTAASITPLNVSKKKRNSLNRSSRLSYVDFPNSSTPKSAIKLNRSSSVYRPIVEDITPASPLPRSSLRNSSLMKSAFTQRRSVNFNLSSASESSSRQDLLSDLEKETSFSEKKRKSNESSTETPVNKKKFKAGSSVSEDIADNSLHDSSLSGIHDLSDISSRSNKESHTHELPEIFSFREEKSESKIEGTFKGETLNDVDQTPESVSPAIQTSTLSKSRRSSIPQKKKLNVRSQSFNLGRKRKSLVDFSKTLGNDMIFYASGRSSSGVSNQRRNSLKDLSKTSIVRTRSKSLGTRSNSTYGTRSASSVFHLSSSETDQQSPVRKSLSSPKFCPTDPSDEHSSSSKTSTIHPNTENSIEICILEDTAESNSQGISESKFSDTFDGDYESANEFSSEQDVYSETSVSAGSGEMFKTPKARTPRKSDTSKYAESLSDVRSAERLLRNTPRKSDTSKYAESLSDVRSAERLLRKTPRKSDTSKYAESLSDVRSAEKLLRKNAESSIESSNSSKLVDDDRSELSINVSMKSSSGGLLASEFDVNISTGKITPQSVRVSARLKTPKTDLADISGVGELLGSPASDSNLSWGTELLKISKNRVQNSPRNDLTDLRGVKNLLKTPKITKSPKNDLTNIAGVKRLLKTPKTQKSPINDLSNVEAVKKLLRTPKVQRSPHNDLTNVGGVKRLLRTPRAQKSPANDLSKIVGVKKLLKTPKAQKSPANDLSNIVGVKKLLKTPKVQKSPANDLSNILGVKKLLKTPKVQKSPANDLSNIVGVKKLLKTPKVQKTPRNDLTNIAGVKKLLRTPKVQKSPKNDLSEIGGVKKLLRSPKVQRSPKNDLSNISGVKKLMKTPKAQKSPKNDLRNIIGVKKLMTTPKAQNSPKNDLSDIKGVKQIFTIPKVQKEPQSAYESHNFSGIDVLFKEPEESNFDKLSGKKPVRTYGKSPKASPMRVEEAQTSEHVLKWLEDQSKLDHDSEQNEIEKSSPIKTRRKVQIKTENEETTEKSAEKPLTKKRTAKKDVVSITEVTDVTQEEQAEKTTVKRTRNKKVEEKIEPTPETKVTRSRRGAQTKNNEVIDNNTQKVSTRARRKIQVDIDESDNKKSQNSEAPIKKKPVRSTRKNKEDNTTNNEDLLELSGLEDADKKEEINKKEVKRTRAKRGQELLEPSVQEDKEKEEEISEKNVKRTKTKKGGNQDNDTVENTNVGRRNRKKAEISIEESNNASDTANIETRTTRRGKIAVKKVTEKNATLEDQEKEKSEPPQKRRKVKGNEALDVESTPLQDEKKEDMQETRSARTNKGKSKKYNEEEWDTPVKRGRKPASKKNVEAVQTPTENTDNVRVLRRRNVKKD